jgi:hypothetical protein
MTMDSPVNNFEKFYPPEDAEEQLNLALGRSAFCILYDFEPASGHVTATVRMLAPPVRQMSIGFQSHEPRSRIESLWRQLATSARNSGFGVSE